ncbi:MAG: hypothetical protein R3A11_08660 [Bdellovibrionota bacterium]
MKKKATYFLISLLSLVACSSLQNQQAVQEMIEVGFEPTHILSPNLAETQFDNIQEFSGLGEPGAQVVVTHENKILCKAYVQASGLWSCSSQKTIDSESNGKIEILVQKDSYTLTKTFLVPFYRMTIDQDHKFGNATSKKSRNFLI